ncbi:MAG: CDF family Co(II)/Ni(II) efflux transporter DmeF [Myxococcales bacterium]|nr:CDF family Co(II)/Ni(II) efflux transporter DmeF [Myxococcales bacterium]
MHAPAEHAHHGDLAVAATHGERRTAWVVVITFLTMVAELIAGHVTGSLALTADGWHMASHAGALGLALGAYWFARTRAASSHFTFGTGKVYALAGFTSGVLLVVVAGWMGIEAVLRLREHAVVAYGEAIPIAVGGLVVNLACALILGADHGHDHGHGGHAHEHGADVHGDHDHGDHEHGDHEHGDHDHGDHDHGGHDHDHGHGARTAEAPPATDHNLRAAYVHVLADALTSVLAIGALVAGKYAGLWYLDAAVGLLGGLVIGRWAIGLCRTAALPLLDVVPSHQVAHTIETRLEQIDDVRVADLHLWDMAPGRRGCIVTLVTAAPRDVQYYRAAILATAPIAHLTVEIHRCSRGHAPA